MQNLTLSLGILLTILGLASYLGTGQESITALIPSFFGAVFIILGIIARNEKFRKHAMHGAAGLALLGALGSARGIPGIIEIIQGAEVARPLAIYAQTAMFLMCLVFIFKAVQSFREARKNGDV
ncbi:MAG: hypothetical protein JJ971_15010 [Balneolaceae bacterium]|nr:hypothetical protein [Balneolaceae bacterium]MBO6547708.1 hypothetical protein [Balneolaceae bacterium]MBO6648219.1 hypothetical protein [Balneolaceae bacterium]